MSGLCITFRVSLIYLNALGAPTPGAFLHFQARAAGRYPRNKILVVCNIQSHTNLRNVCSHEKVSVHAGFQAKAYNVYSSLI
jgi:hypothetical protein